MTNLSRFRQPYTRGNPNGEFCLIGEAPGADEQTAYRRGERDTAFVGESGHELDKMLRLGEIDIENCYFTNVYRVT